MNNSVFTYVNQLVSYGLNTGLIAPEDKIYTFNQLMEVLQLEEPEEDFTVDNANDEEWPLEEILSGLLDYAFEKGLIPENTVTYRDLFDVKLMNVLVKRPSEVIREFNKNFFIYYLLTVNRVSFLGGTLFY